MDWRHKTGQTQIISINIPPKLNTTSQVTTSSQCSTGFQKGNFTKRENNDDLIFEDRDDNLGHLLRTF